MRRRMTWNDSGDARQRRASSTETPNPKNAEWGEDPHPGPYENGEHPATPDEDSSHPAAKAASLERKAAKCIRIATSMLGDGATVAAIEDQALVLMDLSDRSIKASLARIAGDDDMDEDLDDDDAAAAEGVEEAKGKKGYTRMLEQRIARMERILTAESEDPKGDSDDSGSDDPEGDDASGSEDPGEESKGKKARALRAQARRLLRLAEEEEAADDEEASDEEESKGKKAADDDDEEASDEEESKGKKAADDDDEEASDEEESKGKKAGDYMDEESMLDEMLLEEMLAEESMHEVGHVVETADESMNGDDEMVEIGIEPVGDPMGLMEGDPMVEDEMMILAKLFGKEGGEDDEDKAEKEDHDEGAIKDDEDHIADLEEDKDEDKKDLKKEESKGKKAARRPQPKKASTGATRLGGVSKEAASEISELSQLWESAPDVSKFF